MISFILNDQLIHADQPPGTVLLDFIRYRRRLTGTKIGCREGDCGACTILSGSLQENGVSYRSMVSCLMPLANAQNKHIVTVEGINGNTLTAVQRAVSDHSATQCGFCTPGIVMSLTGYCLQDSAADPGEKIGSKNAVAAVDGNICRCTGYKSIERAAAAMELLMKEKKDETALQFLIRSNVLPTYFGTIRSCLQQLHRNNGSGANDHARNGRPDVQRTRFLGGGTDLYVQQHEVMEHTDGNYLFNRTDLKPVRQQGDTCIIGGAATVTDLMDAPAFINHFPDVAIFKKLISSTPIRNMATISGNFVNASPIGDLTIFFLALHAILVLTNGVESREVPLRQFYQGYKTLDLRTDEWISEIHFEWPGASGRFNFEKVSKRTNLDIASVNTAMVVESSEDGYVQRAALSAGGVGPVPKYLAKTSGFLTGKQVTPHIVRAAIDIVVSEISPISDARGSAAYKQLLLKQLIKAHFIRLFPQLPAVEILRA